MKKIEKIVEIINNNEVNIAAEKILMLFGISNITLSERKIEESPILIGHLNKDFGYSGFNKIKIGTPVYLYKDKYYFEMTSIDKGNKVIQNFYKETLAPCINFI